MNDYQLFNRFNVHRYSFPLSFYIKNMYVTFIVNKIDLTTLLSSFSKIIFFKNLMLMSGLNEAMDR